MPKILAIRERMHGAGLRTRVPGLERLSSGTRLARAPDDAPSGLIQRRTLSQRRIPCYDPRSNSAFARILRSGGDTPELREYERLVRAKTATGQLPDLLQRAQNVSLMGNDEHSYIDLGAQEEKLPFDLNNEEIVIELKRALVMLGQREHDPLRNPQDTATETRWEGIAVVDPAWGPDTADEYALAISRYRLGSLISGPYAQLTPVGLQPTSRGLELIAGAVNGRLGGSPRMTAYEAWRDGLIPPPSVFSAPDKNAPVQASLNYGEHAFAPQNAPPELLAIVNQWDKTLEGIWKDSLKAKNETQRQAWANAMENARAERTRAVQMAIATTPEPKPNGYTWREEPVQPPPGPAPPPKPATAAVLPAVLLGAGAAAALWWATRRTP